MDQRIPWNDERARELAEALAQRPGALLPVLQAIQDEFGYVDERAVPTVAEVLNISRAEVVGVIHFYHDFRESPPGRHVLRVCRAEACQAVGSDALVERLRGGLGIDVGQTTADGSCTLEAVYCLGNCALGPAVMLDGRPLGRVRPELAERLIAEARR